MWIHETKKPKGTIVIIHGAGEHHGRYRWLIEQFLTSGYHVVIGDLPGQGYNISHRGYIHTFMEYVLEVEKWIATSHMLKRPTYIVAHSMGALVAIELMMQKRVHIDGLIFSSPSLGIANVPNKFINYGAKIANFFTPTLQVTTSIRKEVATRNDEQIRRDEKDPFILSSVSVHWFRELLRMIERAHEHVLQFPNIPLLILQGGNDLVVDRQAVYQWFNQLPSKDKMYKEFPGLYHEVFNEPEKEEVFKYAHYFLEMHQQ